MKSLLTKIISVLSIIIICISLCACTETTETKESCVDEHAFVLTSYTSPTCKTNGEEVYRCSRCGFESKTTLLTIDHDYQVKSTTPSTCTVHGSQTLECSMCHETKTDTLPLKDHDYKIVNDAPSTCIVKGSQTFKCKDCEDTYSNDLPLQNHQYAETAVEEPVATCFTKGETVKRCGVCGDTLKQGENPILKHDFGADGYCVKCGIYETLFDGDNLNLKRAQLSDSRWGIWGDLPQKFDEENKNIPLTYWEDHLVKMTVTIYNQYGAVLGSTFILSDTILSSGEMRISNMRSSGNYARANTFSIDFAKIGSFTDKQFNDCKSFKIELSCEGYKTIEKTYNITEAQ